MVPGKWVHNNQDDGMWLSEDEYDTPEDATQAALNHRYAAGDKIYVAQLAEIDWQLIFHMSAELLFENAVEALANKIGIEASDMFYSTLPKESVIQAILDDATKKIVEALPSRQKDFYKLDHVHQTMTVPAESEKK
jgi:hypothetical protein